MGLQLVTRQMKVFALILMMGVVVINAHRKAPKIIGGIKTQIERFPFMAALFYFDRFICAGTIISERIVLTAAHCVCEEFTVPASVFVRTGHTNTVAQKDNIYSVKDIRCYENYSLNTQVHDIALIRTKEEFRFSRFVDKIGLSDSGSHLPIGEVCTIIGWGYTSNDDPNFVPLLKEAQVPIVDRETCAQEFQLIDITLDFDALCAGFREGGADACLGDSGGPLVHNCEQVGIISYGSKCGALGVYVDLGVYMTWINTTINQLQLSPLF